MRQTVIATCRDRQPALGLRFAPGCCMYANRNSPVLRGAIPKLAEIVVAPSREMVRFARGPDDAPRMEIVSKDQRDELVGTDGEETFSAVFKEQARSVAVLLRPEWGTTAWTRIEQNAIKNRAFDMTQHYVMLQ